jgi:tetratricopeptide (TPR) repeat protein
MSRFIIIFTSCILCFAIFGAEEQVDRPPPELIRSLIQKLSHSDFEEREKATKHLIKLGYYARDSVKRALATKDPEARMRLKEIWKRIQWTVFPGQEEDVNEFLSSIKEAGLVSTDWDGLVKKYNPEIIYLFNHLIKRPEYANAAKYGLISLINNSNRYKLASFIKESPKKDELMDMLGQLSQRNLHWPHSLKLQSLFNTLGLKEKAVMTAASSWKLYTKIEIPADIMAYFKDSDFTDRIFSGFRKQLHGSEASEIQDWKICFFAKVAQNIKREELIKTFLNDLDYNITNELALVNLSEILISEEMYKETIEIVSGNHSPITLYLRAVAYRKSGDEKTANRLMVLLDSKLDDERSMYSVAEEMKRFKDENAAKLWKRILATEPNDSSYDSNSRFRLGAYYESQGEYSKAVDLLEEGLEKIEGILILNGEGGKEQTGDPAVEAMKNRIYNLREQIKGGSEIWFNAVKAMREEKMASAKEGFNQFIEKNPDYPWSYYYLALIEEKGGATENAIRLIDRALKDIPDKDSYIKNQFIVKKSLLLGKLKKYGKAVDELKKAVELEPESSNILSIYAMTTFYNKDFKKSAELFKKNYEIDPEDLYAPIWRYISLMKIGKDPKKEFADFAEKITGNEWPVPIIRYYNGRIDHKECLKDAFDFDKKRENEKMCEAYYFIGEFLFLQGKKKEGEEFFKKCLECNIPDFRENTASEQRLEELK